eukprot:scaffold20566_cov135-Isochrysis_galbana.AAC.10
MQAEARPWENLASNSLRRHVVLNAVYIVHCSAMTMTQQRSQSGASVTHETEVKSNVESETNQEHSWRLIVHRLGKQWGTHPEGEAHPDPAHAQPPSHLLDMDMAGESVY